MARGPAPQTLAAPRPRPAWFTLQEHWVGDPASPRPLRPLHLDLGFDPDAPDPALQAKLDAFVAAEPDRHTRTGFAVLDLSGPTPRYAGHLDTALRYPASTGKFMIMLGAYQLRHDLAVLARQESIGDLDALFQRARERWVAAETPARGAKVELLRREPRIERVDRLVRFGGRPRGLRFDAKATAETKEVHEHWGGVDLERIFDPAGGTSPPRFRSDALPYHALYWHEYRTDKDFKATFAKWDLAALGLAPRPIADWPFADRLATMIGFSHNYAPRELARDLGLMLVNSTFWAAGLYTPDQGGLWLGNPYWINPAPPRVWSLEPTEGKLHTAATARALCTAMAAVMKDKLVDPAACREMRRLMRKGQGLHRLAPADEDEGWDPPLTQAESDAYRDAVFDAPERLAGNPPGYGTRSFVRDALELPRKDVVVHSKLGINSKPADVSDVAHVRRRASGGRTLRYAVAILDVAAADFGLMAEVACAIDKAVDEVNAPP